MQEEFEVLSLCKDDLTETGITKEDIEKLNDADMHRIARKVGDILCDSVYWPTLKEVTQIVVEDKKKRGD